MANVSDVLPLLFFSPMIEAVIDTHSVVQCVTIVHE